MKGMGNDLKALDAIEKSSTLSKYPNFITPRMCLVDMNGYRLCAMEYLPINKNTHVYGTSNGAYVLYDGENDKVLKKIVTSLSKDLNLSPHMVIETSTGIEKCIELAADVEIHSKEGTYYALDFARTIPPNSKTQPLIKAFRKEYHISQVYDPPGLSSDVFTGFGTPGKEKQDTKAIIAIKKFHDMVKSKETTEYMINNIVSHITVKDAFHTRGINLRYMGTVLCGLIDYYSNNSDVEYSPSMSRNHSKSYFSVIMNFEVPRYIFVEMIIRSIGALYKNKCRRHNEESHYLIKKHLFNKEKWWLNSEEKIFNVISKKYPMEIDIQELFIDDLLNKNNLWKLLSVNNLPYLVENYLGLIVNENGGVEFEIPRIKCTSNTLIELISNQLPIYVMSNDLTGLKRYLRNIVPSSVLPDLHKLFQHEEQSKVCSFMEVIANHFDWRTQTVDNHQWFRKYILSNLEHFFKLPEDEKKYFTKYIT
eukprot:TRINITY_DN1304_c1_g1_i2.p1 TRINITY_DN1304_c1_g1~~TRINITY_DN1304_c1_g1_i2.p1  ORF type:complete len:478 (+),score=88.72 TRINITY_DN1304_c1_g1_i2:636-2069(+)